MRARRKKEEGKVAAAYNREKRTRTTILALHRHWSYACKREANPAFQGLTILEGKQINKMKQNQKKAITKR